jgi:DNA polymerase III subunit beta
LDLTTDQPSLSRALRLVARVTPTRSTLPILQAVRLEGQPGHLTMTATDLEVGVVTSIAADVATPGCVAVPARLLGDYVAQLPTEPIRLSLTSAAQRAHLVCGRFVANLATLDPAELPTLPATDAERSVTFPGSRLRQAIERVAFAAARDEARPILTAVLFDFGAEGLTLAATDGFRLARARVTGIDAPPQQLLVPARAVSELGRLLTDVEAIRLTPTANNQSVCFGLGATMLYARLIEGHFPDVERVIPRAWKTRVNVETAALRQAVRVAGLFGGPSDARPVVFEAEPGWLHLRTRGDESGDAAADLLAEVDGDREVVAVNTRLIADVLEASDAPRIELRWSGPQTPVVVCDARQEETGDLSVVMPLHDPALTRKPVAA